MQKRRTFNTRGADGGSGGSGSGLGRLPLTEADLGGTQAASVHGATATRREPPRRNHSFGSGVDRRPFGLSLSHHGSFGHSTTRKPERRRAAMKGSRDSSTEYPRSGGLGISLGALSASSLAERTSAMVQASPSKEHSNLHGFRIGNRSRVRGCTLLWVILVLLIGGWVMTVITTTMNAQLSYREMDDDEYRKKNANGAARFFSRQARRRHGVDDAPASVASLSSHHNQHRQHAPLLEFPTLQYPLTHSHLVGLYFGASWCLACKHVRRELEEHFGGDGILLPPPNSGMPNDMVDVGHQWPLSIVYISSDHDAASLDDFARPNWFSVAFGSSERANLKRRFRVSAKVEVAELGLSSPHNPLDVPTLLILDAESQSLLTTNGVEDLNEYGDNALDHWMDLSDLVRAMEGKYANVSHNLGESDSPLRRKSSEAWDSHRHGHEHNA